MSDLTAEIGRSKFDASREAVLSMSFSHARLPLCVTDPSLPDNPIVYVNAAFLELTGYEDGEVIGKNCRFLQGPDTMPASIAEVRRILDSEAVDTVEILNYRKDGSTFLNALQIGPICDDDGKVIYFFGSQLDITAKREVERLAQELAEEEVLHRLRNIVNVMRVVTRMTARDERDTVVFAKIVNDRLSVLSDAHFQTLKGGEKLEQDFENLARTVLTAYAPTGARQFNLTGPDVHLPTHLTTPVALVLHELATNSVKHGALSADGGSVDLDWQFLDSAAGGAFSMTWREKDGPRVTVPERQSGSAIVGKLTKAVGGTLDYDWQESGLIVRLTHQIES